MMTTTTADRRLFPHQRKAGREPGRDGGGARLLNGQALAEAQRLTHAAVPPALFSVILQLADLAVLIVAGLAAMRLAPLPVSGPGQAVLIWLAALMTVAAIRLLGGYRFRRMRSPLAASALMSAGLWLGLGTLFCGMWLAGFEGPGPAGARWMLISAGLAGAPLVALRVGVWLRIRYLTRIGRMEHRIVVIGGGEEIAPLIREIDSERRRGRRLCGVFDARTGRRTPAVVAGHHRMGDIADLVDFCRLARIDTVIVAVPKISHRRLMELVAPLFVLPVDIRVMTDADIPEFARQKRSRIGRFRMIDLYKRPIQGRDAVIKRVFDVVVGAAALVALAPVMLAVAAAVKFDSPGPVLFRQRRHGFNNRPIEVLKFRSMHVEQCDPSAVKAVRRDDDRVTRVGRFIRRASLDELPQLVNVLRGDLSLVGPRPHATAARTGDLVYDAVTEAYSARHKVRPGVTGWAQVNGWRGEMNTPEKIRARVEHDLYYIENWSLWLDIKILFRTPWALISTKNAY